MTLDLSQWIRENQTHKGKTFTVTYYAKVNADAVVQTNNSAHLEYGNDPDNITTTTPDVVTTPTYPVQIHKLIKDSRIATLRVQYSVFIEAKRMQTIIRMQSQLQVLTVLTQ